MQRTRSPDGDSRDAGFTLIELLVVIIIIGILSAIAIPVYLRQREQGYDAASKSALRNAASWEEIYLNDAGGYGTIAAMQATEPKIIITHGVTLALVMYDTTKGYCFSAKHNGSPNTWYYDSQAGGLLPKSAGGCSVTTTGIAGDQLVG